MKTNVIKLFAPALGFAVLVSNLCLIETAKADSFTNTGGMNTARYDHTATLLTNGQVLVVGGTTNGESAFSSAELYDPAFGVWTVITNRMTTQRAVHTATLLPNGKVLVAGGNNGTNVIASAELYDPANKTWTATGPMNGIRQTHTATLLTNGKVLVVAGDAGQNGVELYDPDTGTWTATNSLNTPRQFHTATLLPNGEVLVAGGVNTNGFPTNSAEIFDPATGIWTATGAVTTARVAHTATLLPDGRVMVVGGDGNNTGSLFSTELFDPAVSAWTAITNLMSNARKFHTATLLTSGKVLVAGGYRLNMTNSSSYFSISELYDVTIGMWKATNALNTARGNHTATLMSNGNILVAGGRNFASALSSTELYIVPPLPPGPPVLKLQFISGYPVIDIYGQAGTNYSIEYKNSLTNINWTQLLYFNLPTNHFMLFDTTASGAPTRYYRATAY